MISRKSVWVGGALIAAALIAGVGWLATDHGAPRIDSGEGAWASGPASETRAAARIGGEAGPERDGERSTAQPRPKSTSTLAGRVVDESGLPIAGAEARLSIGVGNDRRARTGADGRFSVEVDPNNTADMSLEVSAPDFAAANWWWFDPSRDLALETNKTRDLGTLQLARGATIVGKVLGADGSPMRRPCTIECWSDSAWTPQRGMFVDVKANLDVATGEFRLDGVPPGGVQLFVAIRSIGSRPGSRVSLKSGESQRIEIRLEAPSRADAVIVRPRIDRAGPPPAASAVKLAAADGTQVSAELEYAYSPTETYGYRWRFAGLPEGRYTFTITDPRYAPVKLEGLAPSDDEVPVVLRGLAALKLAVLDAEGDRPLNRYQLSLGFRDEALKKSLIRVLGISDAPPKDGIFTNIAADELSLWIEAPGFQPIMQHVMPLEPGETRARTVRLAHERVPEGPRLGGVVVEEDGETAAAGVAVALMQWVEDGGGVVRQVTAKTIVTDSRGRFVFPGLMSGTWGIVAGRGGSCAVESGALELAEDEAKESLKLCLPARCKVSGRVRVPEGARAEGLHLWFSFEEEPAPEAARGPWRLAADAITNKNGEYEISPLRPGKHRVQLELRTEESSGMRRAGTGFLVDVGTAAVKSAGRFDIDLRDGKLGWLEIEARADGKPVASASIEILRKAPRGGASDSWESERAVADADGRARFGPLPAEALSVAILTFDDHWAYTRPQPVEVVPGTTTTIAIDVPFVRGAIRIRGSDGAWLAAAPVTCIFPVTAGWVSRPGTTGADGTLELRIPPGPLRIVGKSESGSLDWTDSGPSQESLQLKK